MGRLKEWLKEPIIDKYNGYYEYCLDEAYTSYNEWIRALEAKRYEKLGKSKITVAVAGYFEIQQGIQEEKLNSDIIIFANNPDNLDVHAVDVVAHFFESKEHIELIYGDEDELNSNGTIRMNPYYKPDFSMDTLLSFFYIGNWFAMRTELFKRIFIQGDFESDAEGNAYELVLRATESIKMSQVMHINAVLYHAHIISPLCDDRKHKDIRDRAYNRILEKSPYKEWNKVSIVIPSKDHPDALHTCLESLMRLTHDVKYEIIVVDNGSDEENRVKIENMLNELKCKGVENCEAISYLYEPMPFNFSRMCNHGAAKSSGDFVLFLNDDMAIRVGNWLAKLVKYARLPHVGGVGAKLYYPDSLVIQHAGITNLRVGPVHKLQYKEDNVRYYFHATDIPRDVIGVTAACLLMRKELFNELGGFSEELEVAFNDVDLCFRIHEAGYMNVVVNDTHLWHYESLSRGADEKREKLERLLGERELLYRRHPRLYAKDPFYHKYLQGDIADVNYSFVHEYDIKKNEQKAVLCKLNKALKPEEENECVSISIEWAGDRDKWIDANADEGKEIYIQGYGFVAGSDNSLYCRGILLQSEKETFVVEAKDVYRPELENNIDPIHKASMCGFELSLEKEVIPAGEYRVGVIAFSRYSKHRLYAFTNRYFTV